MPFRISLLASLSFAFAYIIRVNKLTQELRRFERSQDNYEREKAYFIENMSSVPITKIDHSDIPEDVQRKKMLENMKEEWEAMEKKDGK